MPIEHRHVVKRDMRRANGTPAPEGTFGFVCIPVVVNPEGGEEARPEVFRSTDWPTKALCDERLAQHEREHATGELMPDAPTLLRKHGFAQDGKGGTRKLTAAELLATVGEEDDSKARGPRKKA